MNQKYIIALTNAERKQLLKTTHSKIISKTIQKRANVLLMSDINAGMPMKQSEIAVRCGVSDVKVFHTVRDYCNYGIDYTLAFKRTKTTNPPIVTGDIEARIVALACGKAPKGFSRWTVRLLTERVIQLNILETVSRETVRNTLKKHNLSLI